MPRERIKTYIQGFDEYLYGGLPQGHSIILAGTSGAMKTSLAWSILYRNAHHEGRTGIFMTFEQSADSVMEQMEGFGLPYEHVADRVEIVDISAMRRAIEGDIEDLRTEEKWSWIFIVEGLISDLKKKHDFEILVFDSINVFEMIADVNQPRLDLFNFFQMLKKLNITAILIAEMMPDTNRYTPLGESFLADGIIHLKMDQVDRIRDQRRIKCVKMRGTRHSSDYFSLYFENGHFSITSIIEK
jgi:KaiC/GvpD/RAD55 family RecA-like ATPase